MRRRHSQIRGGADAMFLQQAGHFVPEWGDEFALPALQSLRAQIQERHEREAAEVAAAAESENSKQDDHQINNDEPSKVQT